MKSHWQQHNALGESLVAGLKGAGVKIFSSGAMAMDLTQTSFSTVPSIDIELGDKASDHSQAALERLADGCCWRGGERVFWAKRLILEIDKIENLVLAPFTRKYKVFISGGKGI